MPTARSSLRWIFVFLALLWLGATFVYFGDTGKHSDDYWVTGRFLDRDGIDWSTHPWQVWPYFWRPLHLIHVWIMNTAFWRHDWVMHLELAMAHAAVCVLLYRLVVRLGSARGPALAAAMLYGTCPLLGEAIGWSSASCNAIGSLLMLITLHLGCRFGSAHSVEQAGTDSPAPARTIRGFAAIALMSFATACFYEPAAAGLAAIPIVVWTASPRTARPGDRIRRTIVATIAAGIPCMLYVALLVGTAPPGRRGGADSIENLHSLPDTLNKLARAIRHVLAGDRGLDIMLGSIEQGLAAARQHPIVLAVIIATALAGLLTLLGGLRAEPPLNIAPETSVPRPRGQLLLLGIVLLVAPWAPFIAVHARYLELRSIYVPLIGVACLIAVAGNALCRSMDTLSNCSRDICSLIATTTVGLLAIAGQVGLIGVQTQFQTNARQDARVAAQFASMSTHVKPNTVFMIVAAEHRGAATSHPTYNGALHTALEAHWCSTKFVRRSMRRHDIRLISGEFWARRSLPIDRLTLEDVRRTDWGEEDRLIPWTQIVPMWIDPYATIHIVEHVSLKPLDSPPLEVQPPRARRLVQAMAESAQRPTTTSSPSPQLVRLIETRHRRTRVLVEADSSTPGRSPGTEPPPQPP